MNATLDDIARLIDDKLPEPEPQPVDCDDAAALADAITKVMKTKSMTVFVKRRNISDLVIKVLLGHGFLCQSDDGQSTTSIRVSTLFTISTMPGSNAT